MRFISRLYPFTLETNNYSRLDHFQSKSPETEHNVSSNAAIIHGSAGSHHMISLWLTEPFSGANNCALLGEFLFWRTKVPQCQFRAVVEARNGREETLLHLMCNLAHCHGGEFTFCQC